jgi:hypothetical protein
MSYEESRERTAQVMRDRLAKARYASTPGLTHKAGAIKIKRDMKEHEQPHWGEKE